MQIITHHDRIWQAGCQDKEDQIISQLKEYTNNNAHIQLVDSLMINDSEIPTDPIIITDNHFLAQTGNNIIQAAPEFWHIYYFENNDNLEPTVKLNCLMNRMSGERLMFLYKLYERDLIKNNLVSFNCRIPGKESCSATERKIAFNVMYKDQDWPHWNDLQEELRHSMPILLPKQVDPDSAAMLSEITIVVETYVSDTVISFSEKIFRALQTPRPWLLFASPQSVNILRQYGFDVLDDLVDHSYDNVVKSERRADHLLNQINNIQFNLPRLNQAVQHNRLMLQNYKNMWPNKLQKIYEEFDRLTK